jgi:hypothetical protein
LESRLLLAGDVNILVSTEVGIGNNRIIEFTPTGAEVRQYQVPYGTGGAHPTTEYVRDVIVDSNDDIQIYNGTFDPFLSTLDPDASTYQHHTASGWSTVNNVSYGGIGVFEEFVFVTDMATAGAPEQGIVRFDSANGYSAQRFATNAEYIDLTVGLDGLLYGLWDNEQTVDVYDPTSLALQRTFRLGVPNRALAVNETGEIFTASWNGNIYRLNSNGVPLNSVASGTSNLTDIDVHSNGDLVVGSRFSRVILTDESLTSTTSFLVANDPVFVSFAEHVAPGTGGEGEIRGTKFEDLDGDGVRDDGEGPLAGVTIYLDQNDNGILDDGETTTVTDEDGQYAFGDLAFGEYIVREVTPDGYQQTSPAYTESFYSYLYVPNSGGLMQPARIDPQTGQVQRLGTPQGNVQQRMHGLIRTNDGEFYGLNGFNPDTFFRIDLTTNQLTAIGPLGTNAAFGLAYDSATDTIYALARDPSDDLLKLSTVDRTNGQLTFIGPGTNALTATSGLAWDPVRGVLVAFDNADDQFWQFDVSGNPTLLWDTAGLDGWGFAYNGDDFSLWARGVGNNDRFWSIDPYAQTSVLGLTASEPIPMESLDYYRVDGGHLVYVGEGAVVTGIDFGNLRLNRPPVAHAGGPYTVDEGGSVQLDASGSTDEAPATLVFEWDLDGDGIFGEVGAAALRGDELGVAPTFSAAGLDGPSTVTVELRVTDEGGLVDIDSANIEVKNVAPVIESITNPDFSDKGIEGSAITVSGTFSDVGIPDTHTGTISWGDGSVFEPLNVITNGDGTGTFDGTHNYTDGGIYTITITIIDDDGGSTTQTTKAVISGVGVQNGVLYVIGTNGGDHVSVNRQGKGKIKVHADYLPDGNFKTVDAAGVDNIIAYLCDGDDHMTIAGNINLPAIMLGGAGNDHLKGGGGRSILIGDIGEDRLVGGTNDDVLIGGIVDSDESELILALATWNSQLSYDARVSAVNAILAVADDDEEDRLTGASGRDMFFGGLGDDLTDVKTKKDPETVI